MRSENFLSASHASVELGHLLWEPSEPEKAATRIEHFRAWLQHDRQVHLADYSELWQWSVDNVELFWESIWDYFEVIAEGKRQGRQEAAPLSLAALRERFGRGISDEDLLLRSLMPGDQVDAMVNERSSRERARSHGGSLGLRELAGALSDRQRPLSLSLQFGGATLTLRGSQTADNGSI